MGERVDPLSERLFMALIATGEPDERLPWRSAWVCEDTWPVPLTSAILQGDLIRILGLR